MKFLTFVDVHLQQKHITDLVLRAREKDVDFIICAGDLSVFGKGIEKTLGAFAGVGKKVYVIPGNHEEHLDLTNVLAPFAFCVNLHQKALEIGEYVFLGYGGGGFAVHDEEFRKLAREWYGKYNGRKVVLVTHGPPAETKLDLLEKRHVGNVDYRKFIERIHPRLVICGHLHERAGMIDVIADTRLLNPGWEGKVVELK